MYNEERQIPSTGGHCADLFSSNNPQMLENTQSIPCAFGAACQENLSPITPPRSNPPFLKHIFLTGEVQSGKSTVVDKVLAALNGSVGGFRSGSGPRRHDTSRSLYLWDAAQPPVFDREHCVALLSPGGRQSFPQRFDALGCAALQQAKQAGVSLILMDECGFLERDAVQFQAEVLSTLDGGIPVLGVVRLRSDGWTDAIRNHPNVTLITVTEENRDDLPGQILSLLQQNK